MSDELIRYHRSREEQCRQLADQASSPDIRRRHEELAALHAEHASRYIAVADPSGELSAV
jgi:hypothetical protein